MIILLTFAFIGGVVTILSPCILPVLPIVLSGSVGDGRRRPLGIITGFIVSFVFFTLFLTSIVRATGISPDFLRSLAVVILFIFGLVLLVPKLQAKLEMAFSRLASLAPKQKNNGGFGSGVLLGLSLGLVWTPCVGPILAAVISLALTGAVTGAAFFITLSYALGTSIPMLAIMYGGRGLLHRFPKLSKNLAKIQMVFGLLMIMTAAAVFFNWDRSFQAFVLEKFPSYGSTLTNLEDNSLIKSKLDSLKNDVFKEKDNNKNIMKKYKAPEIIPGGQWFNSQPLTLDELKGKVVLLDFMTYSCINCIRTFPSLNTWYEKYKDDGLVIIGVHTPEFEFEKNPENVREALADFGIKFPVVQDNNFATWRAYKNNYWPHKFLIDHNGYVVYDHIGEGAYDETEQVIRMLLADRAQDVSTGPVQDDMSDFSNIERTEARSPEIYFGAGRNLHLGNGQPLAEGIFDFSAPKDIKPNTLYLVGKWEISREFARNLSTDAKVIFQYDARKVFMVAGSQESVDLDVLSGKSLGDGAVFQKAVKVDKETIYNLIEHKNRQQNILQIMIKDPGLEIFTFTFG